MNHFEALRYARNLTQQQVADGAGISRGTVIRLEQIRDPKPSTPVATALAAFYEIPVAELLGVESEPSAA